MKKTQRAGTVTMALITAFALHAGTGAAEQTSGNQLSGGMIRAEGRLKEIGASSAEMKVFEGWAQGLSAADLAGLADYAGTNPSNTLSLLAREAREEKAPAPPEIFPEAIPAMSCEALHAVSIQSTSIDSTAVANSNNSCLVIATVINSSDGTHIRVFVALPLKSWNGRFMGTGGGGYAGGSIRNLDAPARKGYAVGATDTGNPDGTANFAIDSQGKPPWQRIRDNAYVGIHDMTVVGRALTRAFYGRAPRYSYFVGGSTGGRQALTEAQRYPQDYDGILALFPAIARDRYVPAQIWPQVLMNEAHDFLPRAKLEAATVAAVKACDGADGVVDGVIDDPTRCHYDPDSLVGRKVAGSTFTATDARIIREIWQGPRAHDGSFLWWGPTPGTDLSNFADTGGTPLMGKPCEEGLDWFRYFMVRGPNWNWKTLTRGEFERLFKESIQAYASMYGGDDANLSGFRDRRGKLLIAHGWADQFVPAQETVSYYRAMEQRMGGAQRTAQFARLFLVPGADHGFGTPVPAPGSAEMLASLIAWVEQGHAPQRLLAELYAPNGKLLRSRPLFPYPRVAKYKGSGSTDVASNFVSSLPARLRE